MQITLASEKLDNSAFKTISLQISQVLHFYHTTHILHMRQDKTRQLYYIFAHMQYSSDRPGTAGSRS